jgi:hypothetical protein
MDIKVLFAWIGRTDLRVSLGELGDGLGPIGQAVSKRTFSYVALISNYQKKKNSISSTGLKERHRLRSLNIMWT